MTKLTYHVATVAEEQALLPIKVYKKYIRHIKPMGFDVIWMVSEVTGRIEHGTIIDTTRNIYHTFDVLYLEGGGFEMFNQSEWQRCPDPDA